uniref:SusC/RagA family TonB-linked outer membrane protein n=1 Tax=Hydrotalea sp. TaxID=2881279 RepID=UPI00258E472A
MLKKLLLFLKQKRGSMIVFFLFFSSFSIAQQKITVNGTVVGENDVPLSGVSVHVAGTTTGITTDAQGKFTLQVNKGATLVLSFVGYEEKQVKVNNGGSVGNIQMVSTASALGEVVVVGYGTQKRGDLTGSVSTIKSEEIAQSKVTSFQEAIQGKMAGVQVSSISGEPGSAVKISIRGASSIYGGTSPLYVIDGVPYDANASDVATTSIGNPTASNPLATLNPTDIESISVLKDASATAIYGSRGANGVIMITTKSGKSGKTQIINYESYASFSSTTKKLGVLSPDEWLNYEKIVNPNTLLFYRDTDSDGVYDSGDSAVDLNSLKKHDWQNEILKTGFTQSHNISISGKNGNTAYSGGIGYLNQGAIIKNNNYQRYNVRLKLDHDQSKNLKLGLNIQSAYTSLNGATQSGGGDALFNGVVQNLVISKPVEFYDPVWDRAGQYISPITMINNAYKNVSFFQSNLSGYVNYQILGGLTLNISGGGIITNSKGKEFYGKLTTWGVGDNGLGILQEQSAYSLFNTNQLTYEKRINKNNYINVMVAFETNLYNFETFGLSKSSFADESTGINDINKGAISKSSYSYRDQNRRLSYFGRLNYTFLTKHLLTATFRADGSDKFGPNSRFGYFPSIAYSWLAINERFMSSQKLFSNLKFRLSYGETGNDRIPSYRYLSVLENTYYNGTLGLSPASQANSNLKWETTSQFNAGVDIGLLNNRIEFNLDFYNKQTHNMLLPAPVPGRTGYTLQWQNLGRVDNTGVELQLSSKNINTKNFQWQTDFNISFNKNQVKDIGPIGFIPITMG